MSQTQIEVQNLEILSVNRLADILRVPRERLVELEQFSRALYKPFSLTKPLRPYQRKVSSRPRPIDNPIGCLKEVQKRINRALLRPICFPENVLGGVPKRSVLDNAQLHLGSSLLVTIDVKSCFPSITNAQVYRVWRHFLGYSTPVASLLTALTTYNRHLPQGAATSPLLANLVMWMIDEPIRRACRERDVVYSTWIDDLAFSGGCARELIPISARVLQGEKLRISRSKIRIMGSRDVKLITGARLGRDGVRAPKDKLLRIRSGIHKLGSEQMTSENQARFVKSLVAQLRYIDRLNPSDAGTLASHLLDVVKPSFTSTADLKFLKNKAER